MKNNFRLHPSSFILLARLWLHEPDAETVARAVSELDLPAADPAELAAAYAELFLLNVYPYGTAFTDPSGELNGPDALRLATLYEVHGYQPPELNFVGAPDHLGLYLGFLVHVGREAISASTDSFGWGPVCCFAAECDPSAHPFYRALATLTRKFLLAETPHSKIQNLESPVGNPQAEVGLRDLVRFFLAPARCGMFLSRSRMGQMAKALGVHLPFGSRFEVAERLFEGAGDNGTIDDLFGLVETEMDRWDTAYRAWLAACPAWQPFAAQWLERIDAARHTLAEMRQVLESLPEVESTDGPARSDRIP